jgi:cobalamin-dependent methionine synthase I
VRLQMAALNGLQQDYAELLELVKNLEEDKMKLTNTLRQQTERRMRILNDFVMRRGSDLKKHGEFLVQMAQQEGSVYGVTGV